MRSIALLSLSSLACSDYLMHKTDTMVPTSAEDTAALEPDPSEESEDPPAREDPPATDTGIDEDPDEDPPPDIEVPTEPVYVHTGTTLYSWNPDTTLLSLIGDFYTADGSPHGVITDIAIDSDGNFYGVTYERLFGVNGHTGEIWAIADLSVALYGLTCTSDGRLVGGGDGLFIVDTLDGSIDTLVAPGTYETSGDLVGLPDGLLYWAVREGDDLVVVDPNTGASTRRGVIGVTGVYGLGFAGDELYGFTDEGQVLQIDASTGDVMDVGSLPGEWYGATTNPVVW